MIRVLGINYQHAGLDLRARFVFDARQIVALSTALKATGALSEVLILCTCNRTECYYRGDQLSWTDFCTAAGVEGADVPSQSIYQYEGCDAVLHLMRVASGLNSLIVGEVEILGQIKGAYHQALQAGALGKYLSRLFQSVFGIAKQVRAKTHIGAHSLSVAKLASKLAQPIFSDSKSTKLLLIGAGQVMQRMSQVLCTQTFAQLMIANRSAAPAQRLALQFQQVDCVYQGGLEAIPQYLTEADIVIAGVQTVLPLIDRQAVLAALRARKHQPLLMIDLGVPRNCEAQIADLEDVYLYCMDDLQEMVSKNQACRQAAATAAESMLTQAAHEYMRWFKAQGAFRTLAALRSQCEDLRDQLLAQSLHRLSLGQDPQMIMRALAHRLTQQLLHKPTRHLRAASLRGEHQVFQVAVELFELEPETITAE